MKKFQIKRWMVITTIIAGLGATVALASCQSSVGGGSGTINCTTEDCNTEGCTTSGCTTEKGCDQNCSRITYTCDGQAMDCSQYMCYGETYDCMNTYGCSDCLGHCTTTCVGNCVQQNCNGGGENCEPSATDCTLSTYKRRQLHLDEDYKLYKYPEISNRVADHYDLTLEFSFDIDLLVECKNIEITYKIIYYGNDYTTINVTYKDDDALYDAMVSESIIVTGGGQYGEPDGYSLIIYSIYADVKD